MTDWTRCPVCRAKLDSRRYGEYVTEESDDICPNGCYSSEFSYGAYREYIGRFEWTWSYNTEDRSPRGWRRKFYCWLAWPESLWRRWRKSRTKGKP